MRRSADGVRQVGLVLFWLQAGCMGGMGLARGDDLDRAEPYRAEVNGAIDVLAASQATPSQSCVSSLDEMHTTDRQLKELGGQLDEGGAAPQALEGQQNEVGVARDVLASDLQIAAENCRPDAEKACAAASSVAVAKLCEAFRRDVDGVRPAKR